MKPESTRGQLISKILTRSWRSSPEAVQLSPQELMEITPLLLESGAGALAWWKIRKSTTRDTAETRQLQQAYYKHSIQASLYDVLVSQVAGILNTAEVEFVLAKGWAVARVYPEPGLRPYGDIDLYVRPDHYSRAAAAIAAAEVSSEAIAITGADLAVWPVDLHRGCAELAERSFEAIYQRSERAVVGNADIRILAPEDHLRLLCIHMLRHGASRPLWMCDLAAIVEMLPAGFNWKYLLSGSVKHRDWILCALGLAITLVGARLSDGEITRRAIEMPEWLREAVLQEWSEPKIPHGARSAMRVYLRHPRGLLRALWLRWPNPVEATVRTGAAFSNWPRLPFQVFDCVIRSIRFLMQLPMSLRGTR